MTSDSSDVNVIALAKGDDRYIWMYRDSDTQSALRSLGRFAANPDLNFTWYDAAVLSVKIRKAGAACPSRS